MPHKYILRGLAALALTTLLVTPLAVWAHTTVPAGGNYDLEYGWTNEPALVNQPNSLILNISEHGVDAADTPDPNAPAFTVDVSALKVEVAYGGQSKVLQLQPLPDGNPGQYVASFVPTKAGQYTVNITGKLTGSVGDADVNLSVNPEDVETVDAYAFPNLAAADSTSANSFGLTGWLAVAALVAGLVGIVIGVVALTQKK
jgi:hypothetical protein